MKDLPVYIVAALLLLVGYLEYAWEVSRGL